MAKKNTYDFSSFDSTLNAEYDFSAFEEQTKKKEPSFEDISKEFSEKYEVPVDNQITQTTFTIPETKEPVILDIETPEKVKENFESFTADNKYRTESLSTIKNDTEKKFFNKIEDIYDKIGALSPSRKLYNFSKEVDDGADPLTIIDKYGLVFDEEKGQVGVNITDQEMYTKNYEKALKELLSEKEKSEEKTYLKKAWGRLNAGASRLAGSLYTMLLNPETAEQAYESAQKWAEYSKSESNDIAGLIQEGRTGSAIGEAILQGVEQIPMLTTLAMGNYAGYTKQALGLLGTSAGVENYRELKATDLPKWQKIMASVFTAMSEMMFENVGTVKILDDVARQVKEIGEEQVRSRLKKVYASEMERIAAGLFGGTNEAIREGATEFATELTNNIINKVMVDPNTNLMQNAYNSFIVGALIGKGMTIPVDIANAKTYINDKLNSLPENFPDQNKMQAVELLAEKDDIQQKQEKVDEVFKEEKNTRIEDINNKLKDLSKIETKEGTYELNDQQVDTSPKKEKIKQKGLEELGIEKYESKKLSIEQTGEKKLKGKQAKSYGENTVEYDVNYNDEKIGDVTTQEDDKVVTVVKVNLDKGRGVGIGKDIYRDANRRVSEKGKILRSSDTSSKDAVRVWESLVKSGEAIKISPNKYEMLPLNRDVVMAEKKVEGKKIEPNKEVKANKTIAIKDVIADKPIKEMEAGFLMNKYSKGDPVENFEEGLSKTMQDRLEEGGYIEWNPKNDTYLITEAGKELTTAINARLQTRKNVKAGTDLFPEEANISELKQKETQPVTETKKEEKKIEEQPKNVIKEDNITGNEKLENYLNEKLEMENSLEYYPINQETKKPYQVDEIPETYKDLPIVKHTIDFFNQPKVQEEQKNVTKNEKRMESGEPLREEPKPEQPVKETGGKKTETGGMVQTPQEVKQVSFKFLGEERVGDIIEEGKDYIKVKDTTGTTHTIKKNSNNYKEVKPFELKKEELPEKGITYKGINYQTEEQLKKSFDKDELTVPEYQQAKEMLNKRNFDDAKEKLRENLDKYFTKQAVGDEGGNLSELFDSTVEFIKQAIKLYGDKIRSARDVAKYTGVKYNKALQEAFDSAIGKTRLSKEDKMRKFPKRIKEFEQFRDMKVDIENNPELYYKPQNIKEGKENLSNMTDTELVQKVNDLTNLRLVDSEDNVGVLAAIELINRYRESGKDVMPVIEQVSKDLTKFGQLIRQAAELKGTVPETIVMIVDKMLEKKGLQLTKEQTIKLKKLADNDIQSRNKLRNQAQKTKEIFTDKNVQKYKDLKKKSEDDYIKLAQYIQTLVPVDFWDMMGMALQGNLLTPMSQITNVYANMMNIPLMTSANVIATPVDALHTMITGKPRETTLNPRVIIEGLKGFGYGVKEAGKQILTGIPVQQKAELARGFRPLRSFVQAFTGKDMPVNATGKIPTINRIKKFIEGTVGIPAETMFRLLNMGDRPFYRMGERTALYRIAKDKGLKGQDLKKFMMFPDAKSQSKAISNAEEVTFQEKSTTAEAAKTLTNALYRIMDKVPVVGGALKFIVKTQMPYVQTPANIISQTLDMAVPPISMAKAAYNAYKGNKREAVINVGKAGVGIMISMAAKTLLENGIISGSPDEEPKERNLQYETLPPNSINLSALNRLLNSEDPTPKEGDEVVNFSKMGILGMTLGIHSNIYNRREEIEKQQQDLLSENKEQSEASKYAMDILSALIEIPAYSLEQSFLKGSSSLLTAINDKEWDYWLTNTFNAITAVPLPNTLTALNRVERQYIPDLKGDNIEERLGNVVRNKLFMTDDLAIKINMWGEPIKQTPKSANKWLYQLFDVTKHQELELKPEAKFIYDLYERTEDADVIPTIPRRYFTVNNQKLNMNSKQYEYFLRETGKERYMLLNAAIKTNMFYGMTDEDKIKILRSIYDKGAEHGKISVISKMIKDLEETQDKKNQ